MARLLLLLAAFLPFTSAYLAPSVLSRPVARGLAQVEIGSLIGPCLTEDFGASYGRERGGLEMMRHGNKVNRLGKPADQRKALLRALTTEVIRHGRIKTTLVRAKAVRKFVDKMIGLSKRGDLHARRQALGWMYDKDLVAALFEQAPERYADREGGYCRVLRTLNRKGDNSKMAIIELV